MKLQQQDDSPNIRYSYSKSFKMENKHIHNHYEMLFLVDGMLSVENNADKLNVKSPAINPPQQPDIPRCKHAPRRLHALCGELQRRYFQALPRHRRQNLLLPLVKHQRDKA